MISPRRLVAVAINTVREAIRNKLLYAILIVSVLMLIGGVLLSTLSYVEGTRIMQDLGLAGIRVFAAGTAIFLGVSLLYKEVDRRTIFTIVSKPMSRSEFLLGKYLGLVATTWMLLACMGAAFAAISLLAGAPIHLGHAVALALQGMELTIVIAVATLFSAFTTPMLASMFTCGIYLVGHLTQNLYHLGVQAEDPSSAALALWLFRILPDLELFNLSIKAVHGLPISAGEIWWPVAYALCYSALLLGGASWIFARRDFR